MTKSPQLFAEFPLVFATYNSPRKLDEDRHSTETLKCGYEYTGIFDGHAGGAAAKWCADQMKTYLEELIPGRSTILALKAAFERAHEEVPDTSGCTATVVLARGAYLVVAAVGDSRAVLVRGNRAFSVTEDHKVTNLYEKRRLEAAERTLNRQLIKHQRVDLLMVTRSIGDKELTPAILPQPEVHEYVRAGDERFLVVASDGLWDVCSSDEVLQVIDGTVGTADAVAAALVNYAIVQYWQQGIPADDITVTVVGLQPENSVQKDVPVPNVPAML